MVEQNFRAILKTLPAIRPALVLLGLRGGNFDAHGKIGRRKNARRAGKQHCEFAIALEIFAAVTAKPKSRANFLASGEGGAPSAGMCEIAGKFDANLSELH